jgi:hypothetical protein
MRDEGKVPDIRALLFALQLPTRNRALCLRFSCPSATALCILPIVPRADSGKTTGGGGCVTKRNESKFSGPRIGARSGTSALFYLRFSCPPAIAFSVCSLATVLSVCASVAHSCDGPSVAYPQPGWPPFCSPCRELSPGGETVRILRASDFNCPGAECATSVPCRNSSHRTGRQTKRGSADGACCGLITVDACALNVGLPVKDGGRDAQTVWYALTFEMWGPPRDVVTKCSFVVVATPCIGSSSHQKRAMSAKEKRAASKPKNNSRPDASLSWDTLSLCVPTPLRGAGRNAWTFFIVRSDSPAGSRPERTSQVCAFRLP